MRVVFAGTPEVALPSLRAIEASPHEIVGVVTRPDAPAGRGRTLRPSPVGDVGAQLGVPVLKPRSAKDPGFAEELALLRPDVCPVVAYGSLVPRTVLDLPRFGWVNLHFSLLPAWRGAAPVQHAILHGDEVTGATAFLLEEGMDTGPVLGTMTETIRPTDTSGDLLGRLSEAGAGLLVAALDGLESGSITPVPQPAEGVSMAPKITVADGEIRWLRNTDFPIMDETGKAALIGGIGTDISEIKLSQDRLEQSEERLRNAMEVGRLGLWDWNMLTGEIHWSDEHFRMEGYAVGEVIPSYEAWASRIHPDDRAATEEAFREAQEAHTEYVREFRVVHPDGEIHWLYGRGRFFYDSQGRSIRMVGAMIDTTARRQWEERQRVLIAELQHRTRNLLSVVRSMAEKTARNSANFADFRVSFRDRLHAMARVQALLSRLEEHDRVTFDDLIHGEMAAVDGGDRVTLSGPSGVRLRSSTVQTLAMANTISPLFRVKARNCSI